MRFATEASYPPFESIDANNQIVGFDVDLAQALCKEIDATCTFSNQAFDSLIPSLKFHSRRSRDGGHGYHSGA
ncbi:transporter substrate-binding domain-containing protein [Escherichia coli]